MSPIFNSRIDLYQSTNELESYCTFYHFNTRLTRRFWCVEVEPLVGTDFDTAEP